MPSLQNIRIGFSAASGPISNAIKAIQRWGCHLRGKAWEETPSHTFVAAELDGVTLVFGADDNGFVAQTMARFLTGNKIISVPTLKQSLDGGEGALIQMLDDPYGYLGLVYEVFNSVLRWLGVRWGNPFSRRSQPYCSNAAVLILQAAGYPGADKLDHSSTWPVELKAFLEAK